MAGLRTLVMVALALSLVPWGGPVTATDDAQEESRTVRYVLPVGVATGGFVVGGDAGAGVLGFQVGNPIVAVPGPVTDFTVQINDDQWGQLGATAMCLSSVVNGKCDGGDFWFPSRCGPYYAPGTLDVGEVVVVGLTYRSAADGTCGATEGYLHVQWT